MFYCCMGCHTFQALYLWHEVHFLYRPLAYQVVDDQRQASCKLVCWAFIFQEYEFKVIRQPDITHQNVNTITQIVMRSQVPS